MIRFGQLAGGPRPWQGQLFLLLALFAGGVGLWRLFVCAYGAPRDLAFLTPAAWETDPAKLDRSIEIERALLPKRRAEWKGKKRDPAYVDRQQELLEQRLEELRPGWQEKWDKAVREARLMESILAVVAVAVAVLLGIKGKQSLKAKGPLV